MKEVDVFNKDVLVDDGLVAAGATGLSSVAGARAGGSSVGWRPAGKSRHITLTKVSVLNVRSLLDLPFFNSPDSQVFLVHPPGFAPQAPPSQASNQRPVTSPSSPASSPHITPAVLVASNVPSHVSSGARPHTMTSQAPRLSLDISTLSSTAVHEPAVAIPQLSIAVSESPATASQPLPSTSQLLSSTPQPRLYLALPATSQSILASSPSQIANSIPQHQSSASDVPVSTSSDLSIPEAHFPLLLILAQEKNFIHQPVELATTPASSALLLLSRSLYRILQVNQDQSPSLDTLRLPRHSPPFLPRYPSPLQETFLDSPPVTSTAPPVSTSTGSVTPTIQETRYPRYPKEPKRSLRVVWQHKLAVPRCNGQHCGNHAATFSTVVRKPLQKHSSRLLLQDDPNLALHQLSLTCVDAATAIFCNLCTIKGKHTTGSSECSPARGSPAERGAAGKITSLDPLTSFSSAYPDQLCKMLNLLLSPISTTRPCRRTRNRRHARSPLG
ncbi:hypothetical protein C7M84_004416 [Penaeus vannamei]|uniref:Uncharacterized protein n=1 Tax=Penaeus vannamei TaxID=6689 RepID=A0A423TKH6_PENVA|nr:hypothetical protein C7M84_004416 [Penaeus vannamei]